MKNYKEITIKEYIENININVIKDNGFFKWCWYQGQYWVAESYQNELIGKLRDKINECGRLGIV